MTWDHHGTLCTWIHIVVHFLTWFSDPCMKYSGCGEVCIEVVSVNKGSVTPNKGSEHSMWSHRSVILEVFGQSRMIIKKEFLIYHLLIKIHKDIWLGLTYFYAHSSSGMLFDWKIELHDNLPLKGILIIFIKFYLFWIVMTRWWTSILTYGHIRIKIV